MAVGGWRDSDISGEPLLKGKLSGRLLAVQGFQGTICTVSDLDYRLHKINGTVEHNSSVQNLDACIKEKLNIAMKILQAKFGTMNVISIPTQIGNGQ